MNDMTLSDSVRALERDLREIFGGRLQSLVRYGPAAAAGAHDHGGHAYELRSIRTLAIAETLTADDLRAAARRATNWHNAGLATPILLAAHEFENALDAFPLEFGAILADYTVVSGSNPFEGVKVAPADLRRACEVQARSHLLHLRQGYVDARDNADALAVLIVDSAPAFDALLRSLARLQGSAPSGAGVSEVVALVGVAEISSADALRIFPEYLDAVERLVRAIDSWSEGSR